MSAPLVLLGPQRLRPSLAEVFDDLEIGGAVAAVTAGWQEREDEVEELSSHLGRPVHDLLLHGRTETLFDEDRELATAYRARQNLLKELQAVYRLRLSPTLVAARALFNSEGRAEVLVPERRSAIQAVRRLDHHHLRRVRKAHRDFEAQVEIEARPAWRRQRAELEKILTDCEALAIAGGHVAVLLNKLRLFGILELARGKPIVAWSAGAMALASKVVLFHDSPPQGAGDAEVLENGLGLFEDLIPLPHARRRLRLKDPVRVALFSRRFAPATCVTLDEGHRLDRTWGEEGAAGWRVSGGARRLGRRGGVSKVESV